MQSYKREYPKIETINDTKINIVDEFVFRQNFKDKILFKVLVEKI